MAELSMPPQNLREGGQPLPDHAGPKCTRRMNRSTQLWTGRTLPASPRLHVVQRPRRYHSIMDLLLPRFLTKYATHTNTDSRSWFDQRLLAYVPSTKKANECRFRKVTKRTISAPAPPRGYHSFLAITRYQDQTQHNLLRTIVITP